MLNHGIRCIYDSKRLTKLFWDGNSANSFCTDSLSRLNSRHFFPIDGYSSQTVGEQNTNSCPFKNGKL